MSILIIRKAQFMPYFLIKTTRKASVRLQVNTLIKYPTGEIHQYQFFILNLIFLIYNS